jgi:hypothetical protein
MADGIIRVQEANTRGLRGYSAYDIAVNNGFVGTEQEWLDSLVAGAYADQAETDAGVVDNKPVSPLTFQAGITNRIADQATAEAGTDTEKLMTAERVAQAIIAQSPPPVLASQAEAEAGTENSKTMTPLRTAEAIAAQVPSLIPAPLALATQAEAQAGTDNTKFMSPLRTAEAIAAQGQNLAKASQAEAEAGTEDTKYTTPLKVSQAIAAQGQNLNAASQAEAEAGTENTKYMTALRVAQAIAAQASSGGGYPDTLTGIGVDTTLTLGMQGIVLGVINATLTFPSTAADGVTYKIRCTGGRLTLSFGPGVPINFTETVIGAGNGLDLIAVNSGGTLYWFAMTPRTSAYDSGVSYRIGDLVTNSGQIYMSKENGNIGNALTNSTKWKNLTGPASLYAKLSDVKSSGTNGGNFTTGGLQVRELNTIDFDANGIIVAPLASNRFKLNIGLYRAKISAPAYQVDRHQAVLYDFTNSSIVLNGTPEFSGTSAQVQTRSIVCGEFFVAADATEFQVMHECQTTSGGVGFGIGSAFGRNEVFTIVELEKVA